MWQARDKSEIMNYYYGNITKENEMGGECGRQEIGQKLIHSFAQKSEIKRSVGRHKLKGGWGYIFMDLNETWCEILQ